jgi:hypothetical protein
MPRSLRRPWTADDIAKLKAMAQSIRQRILPRSLVVAFLLLALRPINSKFH